MKTILINTEKGENVKFILDLLEKIGESGEIITGQQQEDLLLGLSMKKEQTNTLVSREEIFKKLKL